jgi:hypothetical protein
MSLKYGDSDYASQIGDIINNIEEMNKKNEEEFIYNFNREFKESFQKIGVNVGGSYPEFKVGIFNIKVDFNLGKAELFFCKELMKGNIALDIKKIIKEYERADKEIRQRRFEPLEFIKLLFEAYKRAVKISNLDIGKRVNIIEVMKELALLMQSNSFAINPKKENYRSYGRAYFAYDLYRLREAGVIEYLGKRLNLGTATIDYAGKDKYSLYMYDDLTGGNYIMYISFVDINNKEGKNGRD